MIYSGSFSKSDKIVFLETSTSVWTKEWENRVGWGDMDRMGIWTEVVYSCSSVTYQLVSHITLLVLISD